MLRWTIVVICVALLMPVGFSAEFYTSDRPVPFIFDTDIGNDVDDALALGVIHSLQSRGECELLAVTITKDHDQCAAYVDALNTFYGRGNIPIGVVREGPTKQDSKFTVLADQKDDGTLRYPHDLMNGKDAPEATALLRKILAEQEDNSVVMAQVGFSTNFARLLDTKADEYSDLNGMGLVKQKVKFISIMAGAFEMFDGHLHYEYNVVKDIPAHQAIAERWPTPVVYSGYEIGLAIRYPAASILEDYTYVAHHPLSESYQLYSPTPHERPTWDLTSVLWAIRPERGYFELSEPGVVMVDDKGLTTFKQKKDGAHYYLKASDVQVAQVKEALVQLSSQPPEK